MQVNDLVEAGAHGICLFIIVALFNQLEVGDLCFFFVIIFGIISMLLVILMVFLSCCSYVFFLRKILRTCSWVSSLKFL